MIQVPERSVSAVYEDARWRDKYAINVRHSSSLEILRFHTFEEAEQQQTTLLNRGYVAVLVETHPVTGEVIQPDPTKAALHRLKRRIGKERAFANRVNAAKGGKDDRAFGEANLCTIIMGFIDDELAKLEES